MSELWNKIQNRLLQVEKPARYIGGELHSVVKNPQEQRVRFAFAFPDTYEIGMSNLGLQIIYKVLNDLEGVYCERTFAPGPDFELFMREDNIPLFTVETKTSIKEMDMIGFTVQYELSASNIVNMLDLGGLKVRASERSEEDPFVIAGGPCTYNPEPLADIMDFFFIGESEEALPELMEKLIKWKEAKLPKIEFLKEISEMDGIYVPSFYDVTYKEDGTIKEIKKTYDKAADRVVKRVVNNLDEAPFPDEMIVSFINTVHDRALLEIFRGCTRGCRFCQAGMIYRPVRERKKDTLLKMAENQLAATGYEEISLLSLSTGDHSEIEELVVDMMKLCKASDVSLSLPSLRLDSFSFKIMNEIQGYKKSGLTFAPEAGTQRLRNIINKSITDDDIFSAAEQAFELGWNKIKLYFMIGLPGETEEDLDGIVEITDKIVQLYKDVNGGRTGRLNISVSASDYVPKPHTPFQWYPQNTEAVYRKKHMYLRDKFRGNRNVSFHYHVSETSFLEAVFARGDRRLCDVLIEAVKLGCKFDGWTEHFDFEKWTLAFKNTNIDPSFYASRERSYDELLPWEIIDCGVTKEFLVLENERAHSGLITEDCRNDCKDCGINNKFICG